MKKFICAVLAAAMMLSMAAVSYAAAGVIDVANADVQLIGTFVYDEDKKAMESTVNIAPLLTVEDKEVNAYGKPVYYLLRSNENGDDTPPTLAPINKYKHVENIKYKVELESGAQIIRGLAIVKKYIDVDAKWDSDNDGVDDRLYAMSTLLPKSDYYYFAEVKLADIETTSETDVIGKLEVSRKADKKNGIIKIDDVEFDFAFPVFYKNSWANDSTTYTVDGDRADLEWDTVYALKFECDDVVELSFGSDNDGNNEGTFSVDVSGQGKVILKYNTDAVEAIAAANPNVDMDFISFNNVKFNRTGEFVYEMDNIAAAYRIVDGQLYEINGAEFDADSVTFNTNTLGSYVFAAEKLNAPAANA